MIEVDISNVWGQIALPELLGMEGEVAAAYERLVEGTGAWLELPAEKEVQRILKAAEKIREDSEVCVVVGTGGACLGARAAMELLQGQNRNFGKKPQVFFAGNTVSTRSWNELLGLLEDKSFSVVAISKTGEEPESGIAFRALRWMLERKHGTTEAGKRIYAVTDPEEGGLRQMAREEGWEAFDIPRAVHEGYAVLTAAGLLPMAVAGLDILEVLAGAAEAKEEYSLGSFENPVWLYASVRNLLLRNGKKIEILESFEPGFRTFGDWWRQLFAGSGGKDGKGLFPVYGELTGELSSLGQLVQEGERNLFETVVRFAPPESRVAIGGDWKDLDGLNYLEGKTLDFVEEKAYLAAVCAHVDGGVPVITMECGELTERTVGELFGFLELCCGLSAYILGVDPFSRTGVDGYRKYLFELLGKPPAVD